MHGILTIACNNFEKKKINITLNNSNFENVEFEQEIKKIILLR